MKVQKICIDCNLIHCIASCICTVKSAIIITMPRFQSRLFNWIEQSLPVRLGRNARRLLDRALDQQLGQIRELPQLIAYQAARAALYPVYLLSKSAKKALRGLQQADNRELHGNEQSINRDINRDINGTETSIPLLDFQQDVDLRGLNNLENLSQIPLLLRPISRLINWIEIAKSKIDQGIDQKISAIAKRTSDHVVKIGDLNNNDPQDLDPNLAKWIANQLFSKIWEQEVEKRIGKNRDNENNLNNENKIVINELNKSNPDLTKIDEVNLINSLHQKFTLGKNNRLEELRRIIEAAIAYFFGDQSTKAIAQNQSSEADLNSNQKLDLNSKQSPNIKAAIPNFLPTDQPISSSKLNEDIQEINSLQERNQLATNSNLERIRQLIAAAIDYFIGKRSLTGDRANMANDRAFDNAVNHLHLDSTSSLENVAPNDLANAVNQDTDNISSKISNKSQDYLQIEQKLEHLRNLIVQAIAYFFDKQRSRRTLDETNDLAPTEEAWLTMEDVFGDDQGPWPLPLEYESPAFMKSMNVDNPAAINSSGELQNCETTTSQIYQDRLDGSLYFTEEEEAQSKMPNSDRPLRAWLEAKATLWGYAANPVMDAIFWLDQVILKCENFIIAFWQRCVRLIKSILILPKGK